MSTKDEFISGAYSQIKISGITIQPTPEDNKLALRRLENMMAELFEMNIDVGYAFEDTPKGTSVHNVPRPFWGGIEANLGFRLLTDFGKTAPPELKALADTGYSVMSSATAPIRQTQYPSRQPVGSGISLRYNRWNRFHRKAAEAPLDARTVRMVVDDINDFVEHFDDYLVVSETIASYVLTADTGLVAVSESLASPDINFRIRADGNSDGSYGGFFQVKIVATTSTGRIETRLVNFELTKAS